MNGGGAVSTGESKGAKPIVKSSIGKQRDALKQKIRDSFGNKCIPMKIVENGKRKNVVVSLTSADVKHLANDILEKNVIGKDKVKKIAKLFQELLLQKEFRFI